MSHTLFDIAFQTPQGAEKSLGDYPAKAYLIVNTASHCGFTPQYQGLEALFQRYKEQGLMVLAFPCNQFGKQEPGSDAEIASFCTRNYGVSFPVLSKLEVNGGNAHPLFTALKQRAPGLLGSRGVKWNFTKFLVGPDGAVQRFAPTAKPQQLIGSIERVLREGE